MARLQLRGESHPLSQFRLRLSSFLDRVRQTKQPLVITQRGKGDIVVLDIGAYRGLLERIELLQDIRTSELQLRNGETLPHDEAYEVILKKINR